MQLQMWNGTTGNKLMQLNLQQKCFYRENEMMY